MLGALSDLYDRWIAVVAVLFAVYFITSLRKPKLQTIPLIGARKGDWFPYIQAVWRNTIDFKTALQDAFDRGCPVLAPVLGEGDMVILPAEDIKFIVDQPSSVLGFEECLIDALQVDHTFMEPATARLAIGENLIRQKLTPQIGNLIPDLVEEINWALEEHWESDKRTEDGWYETCVFETMRNVAGSVANRAFVGLPWCRDKKLIANGMGFATDVPVTSFILKMLWRPLRSVVAPLLTITNRIHTRRFRNIIASEIDQRMRNYDHIRQDRSEDGSKAVAGPEAEPRDLLQWSIHQAKAMGDPYLLRRNTLADRLLLVNFGAIHTTTLLGTEAVLDLLSSKREYLEEIRTEIETVLEAHGGVWDKRALGELVKLDSAIRESARYSCFLTTGLQRTVMAEEGVMTPSGVHVPRGSRIVVPVYCIMRDGNKYEHPDSFKPFRFSDERANLRGKGDYIRYARNALPTTNPDFLIFGHGKYACPGRFFAAAELKLIIASAILKYDFEMLPAKPHSHWIGAIKIAPMKATIRFKRRE